MISTPAFEAWLRICAEYLSDNRPYLAVYDVDPAALRSAFSMGSAPAEFLASDQVPLATTRDSNLLPFFREDVRRALASKRPDLELSDLAPDAIETAYRSGVSANDFVEKEVHLVAKADGPKLVPVSDSQPRKGLLTWLVVGAAGILLLCVALLNVPTNNSAANSNTTSASNLQPPNGQTGSTFTTATAGDNGQGANGASDQNQPGPASPTSSSQAQTIAKTNPGAALNPLGSTGPLQGSALAKPTAAPQVSVSSTPELPKPAIDAFFATYSATGDDSNPWRMTLHWKTRNVDRVELSSGGDTDSSVDSPQGEVTYDHDPDGSGPIQPGRVYTLKGYGGNQVSTRAVTADPPP